VGVGKVMALSPAENDALAVELPPVALLYAYVMVNVVAVHLAKSVVLIPVFHGMELPAV
jgi:hypothetical protein